jgi:two-component system sensor histidine kinase KdpD
VGTVRTSLVFAWLAVAAAATFVLWLLRERLDEAVMALTYLLVVLGASSRDGRRLGIPLAVLCFLTLNFFLLPPFYTFHLADPLDWLVLLAFLTTAVVAAHLLDRSRRQTEIAEERAREIDRLSSLGAETLNAARSVDAVQAIARVLRSSVEVGECEIYLRADSGRLDRVGWDGEHQGVFGGAAPSARPEDLIRYVAERGETVIERRDGTTHLTDRSLSSTDEALVADGEAKTFLLPLQIRDKTVGVLKLAGIPPSGIGRDRARLALVLSFYAALGVERVRLSAEAERAAALLEADRLKDAFLASVSHDLRTPLTTIKATAAEIRREGDERLSVVEAEADRLNRMVENLLDLSQIRANAMRLDIQLNTADDLLGAALARVSAVPGASLIQARVSGGSGLLVGRFDFVHALRALANLIENALRHGGGKPVEVDVRRAEGRLVFDISDRGPGVSPELVPHLFEPFEATRIGGIHGSGLGLAISRQVTEAQGGTVSYRPRDGGGSVFTLELPAEDAVPFA